jgi:carboxymethylenebutenolidase
LLPGLREIELSNTFASNAGQRYIETFLANKSPMSGLGKVMILGEKMKRLLALLILFSTSMAFAIEPQTVSYPSGNETIHGLLYLPDNAGPHPAIVVIHEWWGLNSWIKEQAARYASQGYVALAIDLYRGQVANDMETAHELSRGLPQDRGVRDLVSSVSYLKTLKSVNPKKIGAVGWCMGGGYALQLAIAEPSLEAVAINYGALSTDPASLKKIHADVLGNFGGQDTGIPTQSVEAFEKNMQQLGKEVNIKIYPDAGHAFQNPSNEKGYRPTDAADARERMDQFFLSTLKK